MQFSHRYSLKIVGESGQGLNSVGNLMARALVQEGFFLFGYREYPSLIKGGWASYQLDIADKEVNSASQYTNCMFVLSRRAFHKYLQTVEKNGVIIHLINSLILTEEEKKFIESHNITMIFVDAHALSKQVGGNYLTSNMVLLGYVWALLGMPEDTLIKAVEKEFGDKPKLVEIDNKCVKAGYEEAHHADLLDFSITPKKNTNMEKIVTGNEAISDGAIHAKARAHYAYPMTPASSILTILAKKQHETQMVVKQAEDEITAAQMTLGSMFMGTRAFTATSGGGFDLMTESVSMAGMTETPFVCVLAQRPGPATGLPTWSAASDLHLAIHGGHGEYPRCVLAASDIESCYTLTQEAFNYAEYFQVPVMLLTEKHIAESLFLVKGYPEDLPVIRNIVEGAALDTVKPEDRYAFTQSGVSKRWFPGQAKATFLANTDEHVPDGSLTEDGMEAKAMIDKRMKKLEEIINTYPSAKVYGDSQASRSIIGWGSVKRSVIDALEEGGLSNWNYVHFEYIHPFKKEGLEFLEESELIISIENNYNNQLGYIFEQEMNLVIDERFVKYNGRPFFVDEVYKILQSFE